MNNRLKKAPRGKKIFLFVIFGVAAVAIVFGLVFLFSYQNYKNDISTIQIQDVDLSSIADGEYFGEYDTALVGAKVNVVVKNHTITEIELREHKNGRGASAETIPDEIIKQQRINVDAVSGATASSKVIMKAINNALN